MIDEKASTHPPPAYGQSPHDSSYNGPSQGQAYPSPQAYPSTQPGHHFTPGADGAPPPGTPGAQAYAQSPQPMGSPGAAPQPGYPPPQGPPPQQGPPPPQDPAQQAANAGALYQQQLFAKCAAGNHDLETKHGIAGILCAVLCFPCGLICLFTDVEQRCVRCGVRG